MLYIRFVQAGGTIDKDYHPNDDNHGYNFSIETSAFHEIWKRSQVPYAVEFTSACKKDSLDIDDADRQKIISAVHNSPESNVIVLHGTDTIRETAEALSFIGGMTIVLTGAMKPAIHRESDAYFNVGMAVAAVQCLPAGIYIALYGEVVPWKKYTPR